MIARAGIRLRFFLSPLIAVACFAAVILFIALRFDAQQAQLRAIADVDMAQRDRLEELFHRTLVQHAALFELIGTAGPEMSEADFYRATKPIIDDLYEVEQELIGLREPYSAAGGTATYDALLADFGIYRGDLVSAVLMTTVELDNVRTYLVRANASYQRLVTGFDALVVETVERTRTALARLEAENEQALGLAVATLIGTVVVVLVLSYVLSGLLSAQFRALIAAMTALSAGNRDIAIRGTERSDEIGALAQATEHFRSSLIERERAHALLDSAIDSIADGVALFDADDRLQKHNRNFVRFVVEAEDLLRPGITFEALLRRTVAHDLIAEAREDPEGWIAERMTRHRNPGPPFEVERGSAVIRVQESRMPDGGTVMVLTDITREKLRERQLSQTQKMEAIGKLTGGVAHDFNNLLAVIAGNLELLSGELSGRTGLQQMVQRALRASERGATLTRSLLAFSRQQPLQPDDVDLNHLVEEIGQMIRRTIPETIEIRMALTPGLWHCLADPGQLQNALLNLVVNACDAMPEGGALTIETANSALTDDYAAAQAEVEPGEYAMLAVSDTGTGMPPEVAARAFDPFFTTKAVDKGTGLGLSMVYGFARQSNGYARIYSEVGVGTTVRIYLPRSHGTPAAPAPAAAEAAAPGAETILVVEDDPDVLAMVVALLGTLGYRVEQAQDGPSGLQALAEHRDIALLLTDVVLAGGMNGPELAQRALAARPGLRVVLMSGYTERAVLQNGLLSAGARMLQKPFTKTSLAATLRAALGEGGGG